MIRSERERGTGHHACLPRFRFPRVLGACAVLCCVLPAWARSRPVWPPRKPTSLALPPLSPSAPVWTEHASLFKSHPCLGERTARLDTLVLTVIFFLRLPAPRFSELRAGPSTGGRRPAATPSLVLKKQISGRSETLRSLCPMVASGLDAEVDREGSFC